jgi:hypothetical protein
LCQQRELLDQIATKFARIIPAGTAQHSDDRLTLAGYALLAVFAEFRIPQRICFS